MAQLQHMDAHLDTLSTELYQVNVHVDRIARQQATMGGFAPEPTPSPPHLIPMLRMMMMMVMTMMLQMMTEMLALPMRRLLDTLPFVTRDKKGE